MKSVMLLTLLTALPAVAEEEDLATLQHRAVEAAVQRVAPSIVRIETVGGLERIDKLLVGTGPTTGMVVDPQGYIVSSAFNFVSKPTSILVRLADGTRKPARLVATDHSRKIVLLKIEVDRPLPVPEAAPEAEMRVGQSCIAAGRTFEDDRPNLSTGIVSALGRIWGKAIQTDAAVSPNNYGGPLVDLHGRVLGILVPLSPDNAGDLAGYEWYDSGIGFAVPLEHIRKMLPQLQKGEDLHAGVAGVHLSPNVYVGDSAIMACRPNSPAAKAGFKAGDRIVEIEGRKITRTADVKQELSRRYAGQKVQMVVLRGQERIERTIELVAKLEPYQHGFLGILPRRDSSSIPGVAVRYVYPDSPAAAAKIEPGDVIASAATHPVKSREELFAQANAWEPGRSIELDIRRGDQVRKVTVKLATLPEAAPPAELPPAHGETAPPAQRPQVGQVSLRVPEFKNEAWAYVPENYTPTAACGVVVWLHGAAAAEPKDLLAVWKSQCDRHDLILVVPKAANPSGWKQEELALVEKLVRQLQGAYTIDPSRVVVAGQGGGATLACLAGFRQRDLVRGVVAVDPGPTMPPADMDVEHRLALWMMAAKKSPHAAGVAMIVGQLRALKIPVTEKPLGDKSRDLKPEELGELARWVDMLDRI